MSDVIVIGSYVQDLAFKTETFPKTGETRIGTFVAGPGGKGFNQAIACHRQGVSTLFASAIGDDLFGRGVVEFARQEKLDTAFQNVRGQTTGAASIVVNSSAENLIVVSLGANDYLSLEHIDSLRNIIRAAQVVVVQAECALAPIEQALQMAKEFGVKTIFNPAPINEKISGSLLELPTILTPNETEFAFLVKRFLGQKLHEDFFRDSDESVNALCRQLSPATVILTLGKHGTFTSFASNSAQENPPYFRIPPIEVDSIDTTGAGDAFSGGLAAGLVRYPEDLKKAICFATAVAGLSTEKIGTSPSMPTAQEVFQRVGL